MVMHEIGPRNTTFTNDGLFVETFHIVVSMKIVVVSFRGLVDGAEEVESVSWLND